MRIVHCLAVELCAVIAGALSTLRHWSVVPVPVVITMVNMAVEVFGAMKPRACSDKYPAVEPLRAVISVRRAVVRRNFVVSIRAGWRRADLDRNLSLRF